MILFSSLLTAIDMLISKLYQKSNGNSLKSGLVFNFFVGCFSSIIFLATNKFHVEFSFFSCVSAVIMTSITIIYIIIGFNILAMGKTAVYAFFQSTGAMVVPYIWGLLFLKENISVFSITGVSLIILSVYIMNVDKSNISFKQMLMCISVFVLAGCVSVISKQHSISNYSVPAMDYVIITSFVKIVLCGALLIFFKIKDSTQKANKVNKYVIFLCALSAAATGVAYMVQLVCAKYMPATVLYPVMTGGTVILSAVFARIAFKEKLSKKGIIALIICFLGLSFFIIENTL